MCIIKDFVEEANRLSWRTDNNFIFNKGKTQISLTYMDKDMNILDDFSDNSEFECILVRNIVDRTFYITRRMELISELCQIEQGLNFDIAINISMFTVPEELSKQKYLTSFDDLRVLGFRYRANMETIEIEKQYFYRYRDTAQRFSNYADTTGVCCRLFLELYEDSINNILENTLTGNSGEMFYKDLLIFIDDQIGEIAGCDMRYASDCLTALDYATRIHKFYQDEFKIYEQENKQDELVISFISMMNDLPAIRVFRPKSISNMKSEETNNQSEYQYEINEPEFFEPEELILDDTDEYEYDFDDYL